MVGNWLYHPRFFNKSYYDYCQEGHLGRKIDGKWVITDEDLERFLESRK